MVFPKILFLFSDSKPPRPGPAARGSLTHDTRPGGNRHGEPFLLGNRTSREAVRGVSFQRKCVRSQKHPCSQRQAAHAFPRRHFTLPAEPCLPGVCTPFCLPRADCRGHVCLLQGPAEQVLVQTCPHGGPSLRLSKHTLAIAPSPDLATGLTLASSNWRQGGHEPPSPG